MIVEAFILGIIIRFLRKKKFEALSVSLKGLGIFFAAIVIKFFLFITGRFYLGACQFMLQSIIIILMWSFYF